MSCVDNGESQHVCVESARCTPYVYTVLAVCQLYLHKARTNYNADFYSTHCPQSSFLTIRTILSQFYKVCRTCASLEQTLAALTDMFPKGSGFVLSYGTVLAEGCQSVGDSVPHSHSGAQPEGIAATCKMPSGDCSGPCHVSLAVQSLEQVHRLQVSLCLLSGSKSLMPSHASLQGRLEVSSRPVLGEGTNRCSLCHGWYF